MKWINCQKKLPRKSQEVLTYVIYESGNSAFTTSWIDSDGKWQMGSAKNFTVTHWMPLRRPRM